MRDRHRAYQNEIAIFAFSATSKDFFLMACSCFGGLRPRWPDGRGSMRPNTLLIDSEQLEAGDALDENFREMA